jgi:hypothetical protein
VTPEGTVTAAVRRFLALRPFGEGDPRGVSSVVAVRLAEVVDAEGSPWAAAALIPLVRYLDMTAEFPHASGIDEIRARRYAHILARVLASTPTRGRAEDYTA